MNVRIERHTEYFIEDGDSTFPVSFEPVDNSAIIQIKRNKAKVGYLVMDEDGGSHGFYFEEYNQGQWFGYDPHCLGHDPKDREEVEQLARDNPGRVFWIHKYKHGMVRYYRAGDALTPAVELHGTEPAAPGLFIPDQQWDVSRGAALYIAPDDCPDPAKYCDGVCEEFSNWCNGDIYGVCTQEFKRKNKNEPWEPASDGDECWGHIGHEWAEQALAEEMK